MINIACHICLSVLFLCLALNLYRVIVGPSSADRAVASDTVVMNIVGLVCIYSISQKTSAFFDLVLVFSLLGFIGTVCFAKFVGRGRMVE